MDTDAKADKAWLLSVQRKLYQWSRGTPEGQYRELWGWIIDPRNLRCAWRTVATNKGKRTPGVDGVTVKHVRKLGVETYLEGLREELRSGVYVPSPSRRKWIPKPGKPGEFRPLGITTLRDRIVQCAVKQIVEPLFEATFWHVSYGFRPGRSCQGALEHIRLALLSGAKADDGKKHGYPYPWTIECDIKSCFDKIDHHHVMERFRRRSADRKVNRLIHQFLKAGVLDEEQFIRTDAGTPQGGILSPLIANIALSVIEERYERWVHRPGTPDEGRKAASGARWRDQKTGRSVFFPIRYADDVVVLVSGTYEDAVRETEALAMHLKNTAKLELSKEKTRITPTSKGFEFLGHRVRVRWRERRGYGPRIEIPKRKVLDLRYRIKQWTKGNTTFWSLGRMLRKLNPILRGWGYFYRYCVGSKRILTGIDWYVSDRLWRWMRKKHKEAGAKEIRGYLQQSRVRPGRKVWREGKEEQFILAYLTVQRFRLGWMRQPDYA